MEVKVTFHAQKWNGEYVEPSPRTPNTASFTIPVADALEDASEIPDSPAEVSEQLPDDDTYESDDFAMHDNAPDWVRDWAEYSEGPYYVETEVVPSDNE